MRKQEEEIIGAWKNICLQAQFCLNLILTVLETSCEHVVDVIVSNDNTGQLQ